MAFLCSTDRYAVIDVETTGFSHLRDRVVEMACVVLDGGCVVETWSSLVNPETPIPEFATAVHGISDRDVQDAPLFPAAHAMIARLCADATVVAHNLAFDIGFLPALSARPTVCSLRLARQAFPNAPNHKNQTLRHYLGIDRDPMLKNATAHRALGDALVTASILLRCLKRFERSEPWAVKPEKGTIAR
jgi:DNA polymerase III epsilon subunit-like protein